MNQPRLLIMATAVSLTVHAVLIGGMITRHHGTNDRRADGADSRAVRVSIQREPIENSVFLTKKSRDVSAYPSAQTVSGRFKSVSEKAAAVSAQRLLGDPRSGIIFSVYFKTIRARLSHAASSAKVTGATADRSAAVRFVLDRSGRMLSFSMLETGSAQASEAAAKILEVASPFPPFPKAIRHEAISFDVRFRFDAE